MEMSIDKAIKHIEQARYDYCEYWEETRNDTTIAFDIAIDTMRKFQKIKEIVSLNDEEFKQCGLKELKEILEVIEDGKID